MLPENLIFDLGGVLLDLNVQGMLDGFASVGLDSRAFLAKDDGEGATPVCEGLSMGKLLSDYQTGDISTEQLLDTIMPQCSEGTTTAQLIDAWNRCICTIPRERLLMLRSLREKGYRIYMLSNTNDLHWQHLLAHDFAQEGFSVDELFDRVFLSQEMHLAKPDPEIYRQVVCEIEAPAGECLFVDDARVNVDAAAREGLQTRWLDVKNEDILQLISREMCA